MTLSMSIFVLLFSESVCYPIKIFCMYICPQSFQTIRVPEFQSQKGSQSISIFVLLFSESVCNPMKIFRMYVCPQSFQTIRVPEFQSQKAHNLYKYLTKCCRICFYCQKKNWQRFPIEKVFLIFTRFKWECNSNKINEIS